MMLSQAELGQIQRKFLYKYLIAKNIKHDTTGCRILNNRTTKFIEITKGSVEKIRFNTSISTYVALIRKG